MVNLNWVTGISIYASGNAAKILGTKYSTKPEECPNLWHIDCLYDCFGSYWVEGWTRQSIIDQALNWTILDSPDLLVLSEGFYNTDKQYIDNWHARNPTKKLYKGSLSFQSGEHCYTATYEDLYPPQAMAKIVSYDIPNKQAQIDGMHGTVNLKNAGDGEGTFRAILKDKATGEQVIYEYPSGTISPGEVITQEISWPIPCRDMNMNFSFEAKIGESWSGPSFDFIVSPCYPSISIDDTMMPARAQPGRTIDLSCILKNSGCVGLSSSPMWFGFFGEEILYTADAQRIEENKTGVFTFNPTMIGGEAVGSFNAMWKKCADWITAETRSFSIYPEDCLLLTLPYEGRLKLISALGKKYEFNGFALGEDISSTGMEREIGKDKVQYFKGTVADESEAEITWASLRYLKIELSTPILVVENRVILGELDSYVYSNSKLPLIVARSLRRNMRQRISQRITVKRFL